MKGELKTVLVIVALTASGAESKAQGIQLGDEIMISTSALKKEVKPEEFEACIKKIGPSWNRKNRAEIQVFRADRGGRKGESLLVCAARAKDRKALGDGSPFTDNVLSAEGAACRPSEYLSNPGAFTEYRLIGAEKFKSLPVTG